MKLAHPIALSFVLAVIIAGVSARAAQHDAHHPAAATTTATTAGSEATPGKPGLQIEGMDAQLKVMGEVHDKMVAARTPEERNALMPRHMQAMRDGASMMSAMSAGGMAGPQGDMAAHHRTMDKRMEMMQATMQLMMDRLPAAPAK